ncbi:non-homologous end-joining DNA ligase [Salegentibacter chungangensis]|uniref:Non-homologous end-joining DNA ligase n=1 Tax=Salegentibacter chungangensis TaxID=1335724 RepID=A0ABW3NMX6_9FLAO
MKIENHEIEISNRDKVFFPKESYTKGDLIDYYEQIAETMLPHLKDRPVTMLRFPNGIDDKQFYQKDAPDYFPNWIPRKKIKKQDGGSTAYVICNSKACLVYLANQACITPHIWLSKQDKPDFPDRMIFDLDPADEDFSRVKTAARNLRKLLKEELGLPVYLMTTGSRGLHLVVPLKPEKNFDEVREFAQQLAKYLEEQHPGELTTAIRKEKRGKKLFLDVARNAFGQTTVVPYGVRPKNGAPVATPLDWEELDKPDLHSQSYTIKNIFRRLGSKTDPWKDIEKNAVSIDPAIKKFKSLTD